MLPPNSFIDPTKVGMFPAEYREHGIRRVLTPRDGPLGLANATEPQPHDTVPAYEEYRIGVADALNIQIEDFVQPGVPYQVQLEVTPGGMIRLTQLGLLKCVGMTEAELEQELRRRIQDSGILPNPLVQVVSVVKRQQTFSILGSIRSPGLYPISYSDLRLLDAIGQAGDMGAGARKIYVIRQEPRTGHADEAAPGSAQPTTPETPTTREPAAPQRDPLVIPVDEEIPGGASLYATGGAGQESQPASQDTPTTSDLEAIMNPPTTQARPAPSQGSSQPVERRFQPLVFDPAGEARETPPPQDRPVTDQPIQAPRDPRRTDIPPVQQPIDRPFDWESAAAEGESQRVIEIDVAGLKAGDPKFNIVLRNRDVVVIPIDTGVFYMMGEIARPGVFSFNEREITLKQAIATVGGFSQLAWPSRCEIIRRERGTDKQITIPVNLDSIFAGLEDDILLRDDDVVNVGTHVVAPFLFVIRNSFRFTYGFGFVYDRNFADRDSYGGRINPEITDAQRRAARGLPF